MSTVGFYPPAPGGIHCIYSTCHYHLFITQIKPCAHQTAAARLPCPSSRRAAPAGPQGFCSSTSLQMLQWRFTCARAQSLSNRAQVSSPCLTEREVSLGGGARSSPDHPLPFSSGTNQPLESQLCGPQCTQGTSPHSLASDTPGEAAWW